MVFDNAQVLEACQRGDTQAQEALYKEFSPAMFGIAMRYLSSREDAQDLLHDAFIKALTNIGRLSDPQMLPAWMYRIMFNTVMDFLRNKRKMLFCDIEEYREIRDESNHMDMDGYDMDDIMEAMGTLRPSFRTVFNMREVEEMEYADIARELGISEQTARAHHSKAARDLRQYLEERTRKHNIS